MLVAFNCMLHRDSIRLVPQPALQEFVPAQPEVPAQLEAIARLELLAQREPRVLLEEPLEQGLEQTQLDQAESGRLSLQRLLHHQY